MTPAEIAKRPTPIVDKELFTTGNGLSGLKRRTCLVISADRARIFEQSLGAAVEALEDERDAWIDCRNNPTAGDFTRGFSQQRIDSINKTLAAIKEVI